MKPRKKPLLRHLHPRNLLTVEAAGVRTAAAMLVPMLAGQVLGYPLVGLMVGMGGLNTALADKPESTRRSMLAATVAVALAGFSGAISGGTLGLVLPLLFGLAFAGAMLRVYGEVPAQIGFVATLTFVIASGDAATLPEGLARLLQYACGGLWATLLTLLLWRFAPEDKDGDGSETDGDSPPNDHDQAPRGLLARWLADLTPRSPVFHHAIRLAVAAACATVIYRVLNLPHGYWLTVSVLVIMKTDYRSTRRRARERVVGSIIGGVLALCLVALVSNKIALDALLVVTGVLAFSHLPRNYSVYAVFLTAFIVLLIDTLSPGNWQIALVRVGDTAAGAILALLLALLLRLPAKLPATNSSSPDNSASP